MVTPRRYAEKTVAVLGLGVSGMPCADVLVKSGAIVKAWDDDTNRRQQAIDKGIPIVDLMNVEFNDVSILVISSGIGDDHPVAERARDAHCDVLSEVKLLWDCAEKDAIFVGITGTNGKSTATTLIEHILKSAGIKCAAGGNLGLPGVALPDMGKGGCYVLEMSSYMLERVPGVRFNVGVFLNLTPDHLERHGTMEGYWNAKSHLFDNMTRDDIAVVCVDDCYGVKMADYVKHAQVRTVSLKDEVKEYPNLGGDHNKQNVACARAVASALNVPDDVTETALMTYPGLRHRQQFVRTVDHVTFINDSKATNPESTFFALGRFDNIYWIVGGREKTAEYDVLSPVLKGVTKAYVIGEGADNIGKYLTENGVSYVMCGTLDVAVKEAFDDARNKTDVASNDTNKDGAVSYDTNQDGVVLLSPACSSFDQFENFEERGNVFIQYVANLMV